MPRQTKRKFWQTNQFKELLKLWDQKLKDSGFDDIECNGKLKQNAANSYRTKNLNLIETKRSYYELLGQRYHQYEEKFIDPVDKYVMQRRAEGVKLVQIRKELKQMGKKNGRETIRKIIRYYEKRWKVKKTA